MNRQLNLLNVLGAFSAEDSLKPSLVLILPMRCLYFTIRPKDDAGPQRLKRFRVKMLRCHIDIGACSILALIFEELRDDTNDLGRETLAILEMMKASSSA